MNADVTNEAVRDLYKQYKEIIEDGSSSNDVVQMLDDWFTENGFDTVLYAERKPHRKGLKK